MVTRKCNINKNVYTLIWRIRDLNILKSYLEISVIFYFIFTCVIYFLKKWSSNILMGTYLIFILNFVHC